MTGEVKVKKKNTVSVRITTTYNDTELKRQVSAGEIITVSKERADKIVSAGFGEVR